MEDEPLVRETYAEGLTVCGHEVTTASSGEEALADLHEGAFDAIVTDLTMRGMSGLDLAKGIRARGLQFPIILMSGWTTQQDDDALRSAGVDGILAKPCSMETLIESIEQAIASRNASARAISPASDSAAEPRSGVLLR